MESYISIELCAKPLLDSLQNEPVVCLVESREMVNLRELVSLPVLYLEKSGEILAETISTQIERKVQRIGSQSGDFQPLWVMCHPQWESDFETIRVVLEQMSVYVDLSEPFERISTSVSILSVRDERFK